MKVLIADEHPTARERLAHTLRLIDPGIELIEAESYPTLARALAAAAASDEAREARSGQALDLALVDLNLPGLGGLAGVRRLRAGHPGLALVVTSGDEDPALIRSVLATGARGYLPSSETPAVLREALHLVLSGSSYTPPHALSDHRNGHTPARAADASDLLTQRQLEVLRLLMRGEPNKLIARALDLTEGTVKIHIAAILRALQARNRTEAVVMARRMGLGD